MTRTAVITQAHVDAVHAEYRAYRQQRAAANNGLDVPEFSSGQGFDAPSKRNTARIGHIVEVYNGCDIVAGRHVTLVVRMLHGHEARSAWLHACMPPPPS